MRQHRGMFWCHGVILLHLICWYWQCMTHTFFSNTARNSHSDNHRHVPVHPRVAADLYICLSTEVNHTHTQTHTHTYIYIYIYTCSKHVHWFFDILLGNELICTWLNIVWNKIIYLQSCSPQTQSHNISFCDLTEYQRYALTRKHNWIYVMQLPIYRILHQQQQFFVVVY